MTQVRGKEASSVPGYTGHAFPDEAVAALLHPAGPTSGRVTRAKRRALFRKLNHESKREDPHQSHTLKQMETLQAKSPSLAQRRGR